MAHALALLDSTRLPTRWSGEDLLRKALVLGCALAMICASRPLPF